VITPALVAVLVVARAIVLMSRPVPWTPAFLLACIGQDALVAVAFLAAEAGTGRWRWGRWIISPMFWIITGYVALNVVVARVLPTPLTWQMLAAAGGPLADSIRHYATPSAVGAMVLVAGTAIVARLLGGQRPMASTVPAGVLGVTLLLAGAGGILAAQRVETWGLHKNALVTLVRSALPAIDAHATTEDWRRSSMPTPGGGASPLHGLAAGRNLVVIGLESTGAEFLHVYGGSDDVMPRLEELARHAIVFERAYAVSPDSIRSLFSVMCSRYPAFDTAASAYAEAPCGSVMEILRARGYRTALFHSGRFGYLGMNSVIRDRGFEVLEDAGDIGGNQESSFGVDDPATVARILSWIDSLDPENRFAVSYLPVAGHHPYTFSGPGAFGTATERDRYRSALYDGDVSIGVLLDGLRSRGLLQKTMVVVYGDHGEAFGRHPGNVGHTFFLYEENVRVPFFVAVPGALARQDLHDVTVSLVDVSPTIFDLLALPADARHQGQSALDGTMGPALFFTDYGARLVGLRDGPWKFIHDLGLSRSHLYDLDGDPGEEHDRAAEEPGRVAAYRHTLEAWSSAQKALLGEPRAASPSGSGMIR